MKKAAGLLLLLVTLGLSAQAQTKAVTENGDEVVLYEDGTWKFENEEKVLEASVIPTSSKEYIKDKKSTFLLKSNKVDIGIYLDPKKWAFKKADRNAAAEFELQLKGEDLHGIIITEKLEIPLETLKGLALENGKAVAPDLHIVKEEYRNVNGIKVLCLQMQGTMQGLKIVYYGYYYSNENGTTQFITYTAQNLLDDYMEDSEKLLNGIVVVD